MRKTLLSWASPSAAVAIAAALATAACGTTNPTPTSIAGTYLLQSIDGNALPALADVSGTDSTFVTFANVILTAQKTYTFAISFQVHSGGQVTTSNDGDDGNYTLSGSTLTLTSNSGGSPTVATVDSDLLTAANAELGSTTATLVFKKQ